MKICRKCLTENKEQARFCRFCGALLDVPVPQTPPVMVRPANESTDDVLGTTMAAPQSGTVAAPTSPDVRAPISTTRNPASATSGLGAWLKSSFIRPSGEYKAQSWWPFIPLVCNAVVVGLILYVWAWHWFNDANGVLANIRYRLTGYSYGGNPFDDTPSVTVPLSYWVYCSLVVLALLYLTVVLCCIGEYTHGISVPFRKTHVRVSQYLMPLTPINLTSLLFAAFGNGTFIPSLVLLAIGGLMVFVTPLAYAARCDSRHGLDRVWVWSADLLIFLLSHATFWFVAWSILQGIVRIVVASM